MIYRTKSRIIFEIFNYSVLIIFCLLIILPFIHIISVSFSDPLEMARHGGQVGLLPLRFDLYAYKDVLTNVTFYRAFGNSVFVTTTCTCLSLIILLMAAYALSKEYLKGRRIINLYFVFTMYFSGGLIPFYLLITNYLHWKNTYTALIVPYLISVFYMLLLRTQIEGVPESLIDSGRIDGASEFQILLRIVLPLIKPTIATISLYLIVNNWNAWFNVLLFADKRSLWTMQYTLRDIIVNSVMVASQDQLSGRLSLNLVNDPENYKMVCILFTLFPIMCIYPFLQKYFTKGIMLGAVKG